MVIGGAVLMFALLGLLFLSDEKLRFVTALWVGYFIFGIVFNYHISSHDYYSLPLVPIVALSLAPLADFLFTRLTSSRLIVTFILLLGLCLSLWNIRSEMKSVDYRPEAHMWREISEKAKGYNLAGLTQDYGTRLAYWGWLPITSWPTFGDLNYHQDLRGAQNDFEEQFEELALKKDLFIVTDFEELDRQPLLKEKLTQFSIFAQGENYIIYDLGE